MNDKITYHFIYSIDMDEIDSSMGMLANEVPVRGAALGRNGKMIS